MRNIELADILVVASVAHDKIYQRIFYLFVEIFYMAFKIEFEIKIYTQVALFVQRYPIRVDFECKDIFWEQKLVIWHLCPDQCSGSVY